MKKNLLRFTIPFHLSDNQVDKKKIFPILEKVGWKQEHIIHGENDLYEYITDLMNDNSENDVASAWTLSEEKYNKKFVTKINNQNINWELNHVGLVLFSTGVGILWYEIKIIDNLTEISQMMDYIYILKELSRGKGEKNYIPVSEGDEKNGLKKISFFTDILYGFISGLEIDSYFANRFHEQEIRPDRAIVFSWVYEISEEKGSEDLDKAFHLGRAYKSSYDMSSRISESDFYIPFEDSVWYACLEGCANCTFPNREKIFYNKNYQGRLNTYFYLYILCLGQYYSLLGLAQEVSLLPADESKYSLKDDRLEVLLDKIHVFILKNNYTQVGHLTQHNEFYEYVQKRLGINRMQQELEVKLQTLYEMVERKKSIRQAKNYKVITIIGGIFVVLQAFINVAAMYGSAISKDWGYFVFGTVGCIALAILGVILWLIDRIEHRKK